MLWMQWFPGGQEFRELHLLPDTAKRHICPASRGQPLAPSLQATQTAYLYVWSQAEQEHA